MVCCRANKDDDVYTVVSVYMQLYARQDVLSSASVLVLGIKTMNTRRYVCVVALCERYIVASVQLSRDVLGPASGSAVLVVV